MARILLTHVGTSLFDCPAFKNQRPRDYDPSKDNLLRGTADPAQLAQTWRDIWLQGLHRYWRTSAHRLKNSRESSGAEIASLSLLQDAYDDCDTDRVVLLYSDTPDGKLSALLLDAALQNPELRKYAGFPKGSVGKRCIPGLKINDFSAADNLNKEQFVRQGLKSYVEAVWRKYASRGDATQLIFNITAGYKGLIPIARDLALLLQDYSFTNRAGTIAEPIACETCYLYETSVELVRYQALPIHFSWSEIERIWELLETSASSQGSDGLLLESLSQDVRRHIVGLFEHVPDKTGFVRRSALGEIVYVLYSHIRMSQ